MNISIKSDTTQALNLMNDLIKKSEASNILPIVKEEVKKDIIHHLDTQTNVDGSAMKPKKKSDGKRILEKSGDLYKGMQDDSNYKINGNDLEVISTVSAEDKKGKEFFYGYAHNWGEKVKDKRQYAGESKELDQKIEDRVVRYFNAAH
jgi:hypothetical protein